MTETDKKWNSLPAEILQQVLLLLPGQHLCNVALVCKAWLRPAQTILFSNVCIRKIFGLEDFYNIIKSNTQLGDYVKVLKLQNSFIQLPILNKKGAFEILIPLLSKYLPNVEILPEEAFESYAPVLNALKDSKLKRLKRLSPPTYKHAKGEVYNYIDCALLMKERIGNLSISDNCGAMDIFASEQTLFDSFFKKLEQFDELKEVEIRRITDDGIQVLEHVVETCKFLTTISFIFKLRNSPDVPQNKDISKEDIQNFVPRSNIKSLCHSTGSFLDKKTLDYIMHKFPCLDKLVLQFCDQPFTPYQLDQRKLAQLLHYLSTIKDFSALNIYVGHESTTEAIGLFWDTTCALATNKDVRFIYSENALHDSLSLFEDYIQITFPAEGTQWEHASFIARNGKYMNRMQISCVYYGDDDLGLAVPSGLMAHIFTHCPNLKHLHLLKGSFRRALNIAFNHKVSLDEFIMEGCDIWSETQKEWSSMFSNIKRLEISEMQYFSQGTEDLAGVGVNMPYTQIDEVGIKSSDFDFRYIKLYVKSSGCHHYYQLDSSKLDHSKLNAKSSCLTEVITEDEYNDKPVDERVYICCQNKPTLTLEQ